MRSEDLERDVPAEARIAGPEGGGARGAVRFGPARPERLILSSNLII
jgi:hypothetical protein